MLGAVEVYAGGRVHAFDRPQQGVVLAALIADVGRPVPADTLVDRVWGEAPPPRARRILHTHIARLRKLLERASAFGDEPATVVRRGGGYSLEVRPDSVDLHRFRDLVSRAGAAAGRAGLLREALDLWRGEPLSGLSGQWVEQTRHVWTQQRLHAAVEWARAELDEGDPAAALPRLASLAGEYPLVEPLAAAYLRALYAAGRPADALEHYAALRHRLADELGTDPSAELQQLHRQILSADPALAPPPAQPPVPRQLPAPPQLFTGRMTELADLDKVVDASTVVITAIDGMAGVGKTALAVQAAHRIADQYPDGQLFIDLHGYTQGVDPVEPGEALDHLLRGVGVPGTQIPETIDQRAALYRTRLADQRVLIVLDNAATETQVTPLLPGSAGCLVLVTSRHRLTGLDQTYTLSLDTLPVPDAIALFTRTAGEDRLAGQPPDRPVELVELCGRLPLAIRIAAARLRAHPSWGLSDLVARLRDQQHRLGELVAGQRSVTAALDLSYHHLGADERLTYRLLGLHPGPDIDGCAAAALLDSTVAHARRLLDQLHDAHLLQEPEPGRYRFHDLTRAHAAHTVEPADHVAVDRLLDYYRHTAAAAMDAAYPYEREHRPQVPSAQTPIPELPDPAAALSWLDFELPNLLAAARYAIDHDRPEYILQLSSILHRDLASRGRYHEAGTLHHEALVTARAIGRRADELDAFASLGGIHLQQGRYAQATDTYQQALQIARAIGHRPGELKALTGLGNIHWLQGRHAQATDTYQQALQIARAIGHRSGELNVLTGLGHIEQLQGRYAQATEHLDQALRIARAMSHRIGELSALASLGNVHWRTGRYAQATDHLDRALQIARAIGYRAGELNALTGLGNIYRRHGRHAQASGYYRRLLDLAHEVGDLNAEFEARQGMGRLRNATGDPQAAISHHHRALVLASELGQPLDQARAHDGLAHAHQALNRHEQAHDHWHSALEILTGLGVDHTPDDEETTVAAIRDHLTRPGRQP